MYYLAPKKSGKANFEKEFTQNELILNDLIFLFQSICSRILLDEIRDIAKELIKSEKETPKEEKLKERGGKNTIIINCKIKALYLPDR